MGHAAPLLAAVALDPLRRRLRHGRRHRRRGPAPAAAAASSATASSATAASATAAAAAWCGRAALSRPDREADCQLALRRRRRGSRQHGLVGVPRRAWHALACSWMRQRHSRRGEGIRRCRHGRRRALRCCRCILSHPWIGAVIHGDSSGVWVVQRSLSRCRAAVLQQALCESPALSRCAGRCLARSLDYYVPNGAASERLAASQALALSRLRPSMFILGPP